MTREEQIIEYANSFKGKGMESDELKEIVRLAIIDGAKWADAHPRQPSLHSNIDEEITSNPEYCPKLQTQYSLYQKTLYEIATILSKYEDKDGSPLEQIRSIVINDTIDKMEKEPEVDLEKEKDLALTANDIKLIADIIEKTQEDGQNSGFYPPDWYGTESFYDEVLRRYNESKSIN